jgi:hypothetical protein
MYESAEIIIRLDSAEVQQALGIWLDEDAQQAVDFIREKIVNRVVRNTCKSSAGRKTAPCHMTRSNCACCRTGNAGRKIADGGSSFPSPRQVTG